MTRTDKNVLIASAIAAVVLIAWLLWKRYSKIAAAPTTPAALSNPTSQDAYQGPTGLPIVPQIQYGQPAPFQLELGSITLPGYHYSGNQQIYMPLFGFVGYSNYASG